MQVKLISREECKPFILDIHYAKRFPSVSFAYGLFDEDELIGVVTYGSPFSSTLRNGICGAEYGEYVIELNRLCLKYNRKNEASYLVGRSIRLLPKNKIIVSFADTAQGHQGYVYQATNFIYCGLSAKRTDWKVKGLEHLHGQTISDEFRGLPNRSKLMKDKYGDDFYLEERSRKHRYMYIHGNDKFKQNVLKNLKYKIEQYPKGLQ